jgi:cytochrome P450
MKNNANSQGNALIETLKLIADPIKFLDSYNQVNQDSFVVPVLGINSPPVVFFNSPEAIGEIFTIPSEKFDFSRATHVFRPLMGDSSIVLQEGRSHQRLRQLLVPPFHGERMRYYGANICKITQQVTQQWRSHSVISLPQYLPQITLDIILQIVFGFNAGERYERMQYLLTNLLEDVTKPLFSSLFFFPPLQQDWGTWSPWGNFLKRRAEIDRLIYAEIVQRRTEFDPERTDILTLLLSARDETGAAMTDQELRDQLVSLLLLGYETTAGSLAWAFYLLHSHPAVLAQVRSEIASITPPGTNLDPEAIAKLPYLNAVTQETMRLHPIALIGTPRMAKVNLQIHDQSLTPGAIVVPCIYLAHQRAATYPQPQQFQPERFLTKKYTSTEYLPFGGGARGCIGSAFAMYEIKLIITQILTQFELKLIDPKPVKPIRRGITIVPSGKLEVAVTPLGQGICLDDRVNS